MAQELNPNVLAMALGMASNLFNPGGQQGANYANVAGMAINLAQRQQQAQLLASLLGAGQPAQGQATAAPQLTSAAGQETATKQPSLGISSLAEPTQAAGGVLDLNRLKGLLVLNALGGLGSNPFGLAPRR